MKIKVRFEENNRILKTTFDEINRKFNTHLGDLYQVTKIIGGEAYDGDYAITPRVDPQTMLTKDKVMLEDVMIKAIPFYNVSNTSGGSTVYIGNEV